MRRTTVSFATVTSCFGSIPMASLLLSASCAIGPEPKSQGRRPKSMQAQEYYERCIGVPSRLTPEQIASGTQNCDASRPTTMTPASSCTSGEHGVWYAKPELICSLTVLASTRDGKGDADNALRRHNASRAAARGPLSRRFAGAERYQSEPSEHDPEKCEAVFRKDHAQTIA
jgi:hypothetical protein